MTNKSHMGMKDIILLDSNLGQTWVDYSGQKYLLSTVI